jgi:predicted N-acyltransferase
MSDPGYTATVHPSTASIPAETWNRLASGDGCRPDNPFLDHAFFMALEESGCATGHTGWQPQHILLTDAAGTPVGLMPLFLKSHSMGEYVFDHGWANAFAQAGGSYYPKLQCSVPFTPVTAPKLLAPSGSLDIRAHLLAAAQQLARQDGASSVHATFVPEEEADAVEASGWLKRVDTQFHWHNHGFSSFEDFLETLSSRKRKTIRR